jgi:hypothetical protein
MKAKSPRKLSSEDANKIAQYCTVIHEITAKARYDINLGGLLNYTPPKGAKAALYALGYRRGHGDAYFSQENVERLGSAVNGLMEEYEKIRMGNSKRRKKRNPTLLGLVKDAYVRATKG